MQDDDADEESQTSRYRRWWKFSFNNLAFEPEVVWYNSNTFLKGLHFINYLLPSWSTLQLKQFVIEGRNGDKKRSINYRAGWNIDEHRVNLSELVSRYGTDLKNVLV